MTTFLSSRASNAFSSSLARGIGPQVLNREELTNLLSDLGLELTHAELEMMLKRLDPDHDG